MKLFGKAGIDFMHQEDGGLSLIIELINFAKTP